MQTMKSFFAALLAIALIAGISSCNKHTCPTYSKADQQQTEVRA